MFYEFVSLNSLIWAVSWKKIKKIKKGGIVTVVIRTESEQSVLELGSELLATNDDTQVRWFMQPSLDESRDRTCPSYAFHKTHMTPLFFNG